MQKQFIKTLYPAIGLALIGMSGGLQASVISASADWSLGGGTFSDSDGSTNSTSVDILDGDSDIDGNSVFYHTYGNSSGTFGSRVSGDNTFDISAQFVFEETYQNTSSSAQHAFFDFSIVPGEVGLSFYGDPMGTGNFLRAGYEIDILVNRASQWSSAYSLSMDDSGTAQNSSGTSINGTLNAAGNRYSWSTYDGHIDLGLFVAGETFTLEYLLTTVAAGDMTGVTGCNSYYNPEIEGAIDEARDGEFFEGEGGSSCGSAIARSGDPLDPWNTPTPNGGSVSFASVPEPSTMLLLGLGFVGLFASRKK